MTLDPNTRFAFGKMNAEIDIALLRHYTGRMGDLLTDAQASDFVSNQSRPEMLENVEDELIPLHYCHTICAGFLISVAIFLERQMREFAFALDKAGHLGLSLRDMSGSLPERFRKYCLHVARLPSLTSELNWQDVCGFVEIRNCLVHADSILDGFSKANVIKSFVARHGTPTIDEPHLLVDAATSHKCLDVVTDFIGAIYNVAIEAYPYPRRR